jgi:hypothetical protein
LSIRPHLVPAVDGLEIKGLPVTLANTVDFKQYAGLKYGDDTAMPFSP